MNEVLLLHYEIRGGDFIHAGESSGHVKNILKRLGFHPNLIRRTAIAMYEGEINMVIHAGGGTADVKITPEQIEIRLADHGPGIKNLDLAMREGYSTASDSVRELGFGAGMGLPNMKKYADDLKIRTAVGKGTTVSILTKVSRNQG
ncbi:MAG: ATP-binding protein [Oscillospiraceae bacterium]|jgi:anti-sigma regulatory factor (Ser/Thr protein kinase)|nr:ATP-binding protein [Oscillospiraceae bacterium]